MKFAKALQRELSHADEGNWRERLDALKSEHGTWQGVADHLGVHKRTVERWRLGYQPRVRKDGTRPPRQPIGDKAVKRDILPKLQKAMGSSRKAQLLGAPDLKRMQIRGHISIGHGEYERDETMLVGNYMADGDFEAITQAYLDGDDAAVNAAMDRYMADTYIGDGATKLTDVSTLWF